MLTAISVARQCGMVAPKDSVIQVDAHPPEGDKPASLVCQYADIDSQQEWDEEHPSDSPLVGKPQLHL